ncbi:trypsin-like serine peptidase [Nonomuraea dietziae]|uniref:trypsin-like serine peptidase n=1 Tax=Nonomuraea dietziae TaxID=65515 RepID=UPI003442070B
MKRILIPASGAVLATGLLAAGLAGTAQATSDVASDPMAKNAAVAQSIAQYWAESNGAALRAATESNIWDSKDVAKLKSTGGYSADTKPGVVAPIGEEKKTATKSQNVNMPKTIGKVFFVNSKGERKWCSATSIQSRYRNLVSTAGHCVYDTAGNADTMSKWVFVPGYYQGKAPFGIYVGKQAFTHYDFDVYEDFDRDYAFVTVYNGIKFGGTKQVSKSDFDKHNGPKWADSQKKQVTKDEYLAYIKAQGGKLDGTEVENGVEPTLTNPDDPRGVYAPKEVSASEYEKAKDESVVGNGAKADTKLELVSKAEWNAYKGEGTKLSGAQVSSKDNIGLSDPENGPWAIKHFFVKQWIIPGKDAKYYIWTVKYYVDSLTDAGRLGDAVGGQGFAYNQPTGKYVRVFGYPASAHPDGHKNFTGITPKWCYGKTTAKTVGSAAKKIEEHIALKCSMTEGADGGPWLLKYSNAKRLGYVNGVTSTFNDQDGNDRVDYISSPYFDGETNTVYKAAANVWSGKIVG